MSPALHTPFPTKDVYILMPTTCEYVMWHVKGELRLKIEWMLPIRWAKHKESIHNSM